MLHFMSCMIETECVLCRAGTAEEETVEHRAYNTTQHKRYGSSLIDQINTRFILIAKDVTDQRGRPVARDYYRRPPYDGQLTVRNICLLTQRINITNTHCICATGINAYNSVVDDDDIGDDDDDDDDNNNNTSFQAIYQGS